MNAQIRVYLNVKSEGPQIKLAELNYEPEEGRIPAMVIKEAKVELPDGSTLMINSSWLPNSNMVSLLVFRNGVLVGHSGNCWHLGEPYLGVQIENAGFLHLYLKKQV
jgi:hypothetical protein